MSIPSGSGSTPHDKPISIEVTAAISGSRPRQGHARITLNGKSWDIRTLNDETPMTQDLAKKLETYFQSLADEKVFNPNSTLKLVFEGTVTPTSPALGSGKKILINKISQEHPASRRMVVAFDRAVIRSSTPTSASSTSSGHPSPSSKQPSTERSSSASPLASEASVTPPLTSGTTSPTSSQGSPATARAEQPHQAQATQAPTPPFDGSLRGNNAWGAVARDLLQIQGVRLPMDPSLVAAKQHKLRDQAISTLKNSTFLADQDNRALMAQSILNIHQKGGFPPQKKALELRNLLGAIQADSRLPPEISGKLREFVPNYQGLSRVALQTALNDLIKEADTESNDILRTVTRAFSPRLDTKNNKRIEGICHYILTTDPENLSPHAFFALVTQSTDQGDTKPFKVIIFEHKPSGKLEPTAIFRNEGVFLPSLSSAADIDKSQDLFILYDPATGTYATAAKQDSRFIENLMKALPHPPPAPRATGPLKAPPLPSTVPPLTETAIPLPADPPGKLIVDKTPKGEGGNCAPLSLLHQLQQRNIKKTDGNPYTSQQEVRSLASGYLREHIERLARANIEGTTADTPEAKIMARVVASMKVAREEGVKLPDDITRLLDTDMRATPLSKEQKKTLLNAYANLIDQNKFWLDVGFFEVAATALKTQIVILQPNATRNELLIMGRFPEGSIKVDRSLFICYNGSIGEGGVQGNHFLSTELEHTQKLTSLINKDEELKLREFIESINNQKARIKTPRQTDQEFIREQLSGMNRYLTDLNKANPDAYNAAISLLSARLGTDINPYRDLYDHEIMEFLKPDFILSAKALMVKIREQKMSR